MPINLTTVYGDKCDKNYYLNRIKKLQNKFYNKFSSTNYTAFSSSGRIEICGNHTDHNFGKTMALTINCDTFALAEKQADIIRISSDAYHDLVVKLNDINFVETELGTSLALIKGIVRGFLDKGLKVGGFKACLSSNIFKGAGVSSSASFELLICEILNVFYNKEKVSTLLKAQISQFSENKYFGKPCGLLDQLTISNGGLCYVDFKNINKPLIKNLSLNLDKQMILINTGGDHAKLSNAYAEIKLDMAAVSNCLNKKFLREISFKEFVHNLPKLSKNVSGRAILRATHFFEENERVESAYNCLTNNNIDGFLLNIQKSGDSSWKLLQNCYVATDTEQKIPLALTIGKLIDNTATMRVHGGGFKGTVLAFVSFDKAPLFIEKLGNVFGKKNILICMPRNIGTTKLDSLDF